MEGPHHKVKRTGIRGIIRSAIVITASMIICSFVAALGLYSPCLFTFYDGIPIYPDAELIEDVRGLHNYMGIGTPFLTYASDDEHDEVHIWYREWLRQHRRALRSPEPPPEWNGNIEVLVGENGGAMIILSPVCRNGNFGSGDAGLR